MSRQFSKEVKRLAWKRCASRCENGDCGASISFRVYHFDHRIRWELTRDSTLANCQVLCVWCHLDKTASEAGDIAKADHAADRHDGLAGPGRGNRPMGAGRKSGLTKTFNHGVQRRPEPGDRHRALMAWRGRLA
jgi:hypothetical protein